MQTKVLCARALIVAASFGLTSNVVAASRPDEPAPSPAASPRQEMPPYVPIDPANRFQVLIDGEGPDWNATLNLSRVTFAQEGADFDPSVSGDGSLLAFASTQHSPTADVYVKRTDSRLITRLTSDPADDMMPRISPDGSQIAFASNRAGNWDIFVIPASGGRAMQVTSEPADEISPSWSPDGSRLVFCRRGEMSGRWEMWVADASKPSVSSFIGYGLFPQWCPVAGTGADGADQILYQLGRDRGRRTYGLWVMDLADGMAGNPSEVASSAEQALINPAWSPDGRWIVYAQADPNPKRAMGGLSRLHAPERRISALWMISAQGEGKIRLTGDETTALSPVWSSENRLYFVSSRDGLENIWSLDVRQAVATAQALVRSGSTETPQSETVQAPEPE